MNRDWVRALVYAALLFGAASLSDLPAAQTRCGTERWDIKTLSDPATSQVVLTPTVTTVEQLQAIPIPGPIELHTPRYAVEKQTVTVTATLKAAKLETDSDYHVVIAGSTGATMIAEFANPSCVANAQFRRTIGGARQAFVRRFGTPPSTHFVTLHGVATLTGVVFLDVLHAQRGVAPNGVEIHPVLGIK
jgi:hypothetical protein